MGVCVDVKDRHGSKARLLREEVVLYPHQPHGGGDGAAAKSLDQVEDRVGDRGPRIMPRHLHASSARVRAPQEPSVLDGDQEAGVDAGSLRTGLTFWRDPPSSWRCWRTGSRWTWPSITKGSTLSFSTWCGRRRSGSTTRCSRR